MLFICQKWWGPSSHPGVRVGLCGIQSHAQKVLWQCGQGMVATVGNLFVLFPCLSVLFSYCCPVGFAGFYTLVNSVQSVSTCWCSCWRSLMRLLVCLCSTFPGLLWSASLVAVHHSTVSFRANSLACKHMPCPAKLWLHQDGAYAGQASTSEDLSVWDLVVPLDVKEFSHASGVEVIQLPCMTLADCPHFTAIEEGGENYGPVNLYLCL